ncbi:MAG: D-2-hydroxyacid dehydrogenase [Acidobacteriota bacterium]|nr:D-2-hydroxyacid dehydrogenase [Acidobacteriota bacterium]
MMKTRTRLATLAALALLLTGAAGAQQTTLCVFQGVAGPLADLSDELPLSLVPFSNFDDLKSKVGDCEGIVGLIGGDLDDLLRSGPKLRWMQTLSAGVETVLVHDQLAASDITLTNAKIIQGPEIADHAIGLLLNFTRNLKHYNQHMDEGWNNQGGLPIIELRGKTALIIGLGGIGTQIAQRAAAFEMRVLAVDPKDIPIHRDVAYVGKPDELDALLPEADVVISSVPHTPASRGMLGKKQFDLMKDGVYLINISRGPIVDTDALVAALRSGKVRAAGLDVTNPEPLPADHPLWSMPNVTITPHIATRSDMLNERRIQLFRDNVTRFVKKQPLRHVVDKEKGY